MGSYNYYRMFGCFNRKFKISETGPPPDVRDAFSRYTEKGTHMSADQLARFLVEYQGEKSCTVNDAEQIIQQVVNRRHHLHLTKYTRRAQSLEIEEFFYYLFQDDLNGPIKSQVHHDMNAPLHHYFIYTGHNSYLTGNQLSSDCSEIPIIRALERGVRGIELDLWPNSAKDNIHVLHGRTLTTPVPLLTCFKSIREHAFTKSPYPVIITLEDHLTPELQAKVAEMVIQTFGEMLYYPESECLEEFPSPEELKHRIILSTKPPKEYLGSKHQRDRESPSPERKDSFGRDFVVKGTSEITAEEHDADQRSDIDQDNEDNDTYQSSQQGGPQYKRLIAMNPEELKHEIILSTTPPEEHIEAEHYCDRESASPMMRDPFKDNCLIKETSEIIADEHGADESCTDQDDEDSEYSNYRSSQVGEPQYKRLIAFHGGKAKHGLKHVLTPEERKHRIILSVTPPEKYLEANHHRDGEGASPMMKDSFKENFLVKETSETITEEHEADGRNDSDQDDEDTDASIHQSSQVGAPQYKRMIAIHGGKGKSSLENALRPEELKHRTILSIEPPEDDLEKKHNRDSELASPVRKDSFDGDFLVKEASEITAEEHEADGKIGAPQYKRLIAMHAGKAKHGLKHALTPKELKHRIILPTKAHEHFLETKHQRDKESASPVRKDLSEEDILVKETSEVTEENEADDRSDTDQDDEDGDTSNYRTSQLEPPPYKRLIAIHAGKAKHGLKRALTDGTMKVKRLSLDEQALERAATNYGKDLVRFTQMNILRVFPKGTRVTSSNFKAMTGWMHGAQMVAFNMQGYGKALWIMHGMFRSNGGCGYVKKPSFLLEKGPHNEVFDPKVQLPVQKTLQVRVYLGDGWRMDFSHTHFDSYSPPDFYTKLYIIGVPADAGKGKTKIIEDDWGPTWGEEFKFPLTVPEMALLRIEVREYDMSEKDDFGGQTCLAVSELRPGIRAVPLFDKKGEKLKSVRLLMRFQFV